MYSMCNYYTKIQKGLCNSMKYFYFFILFFCVFCLCKEFIKLVQLHTHCTLYSYCYPKYLFPSFLLFHYIKALVPVKISDIAYFFKRQQELY